MLIEITQLFILSGKFLLVNNTLSNDKSLLNTCSDLRGFLKVNSVNCMHFAYGPGPWVNSTYSH